MGTSKGGLVPDSCCEDEAACLADMKHLIEEFHDNSKCAALMPNSSLDLLYLLGVVGHAGEFRSSWLTNKLHPGALMHGAVHAFGACITAGLGAGGSACLSE